MNYPNKEQDMSGFEEAAVAAPIVAEAVGGTAAVGTGATAAGGTAAGTGAAGVGASAGTIAGGTGGSTVAGGGLLGGAAETSPLLTSNLGGSIMGGATGNTGMAGGMGSGYSGIPLAQTAGNAGITIGQEGALSFTTPSVFGSGGVGGLGGGTSGIAMPTAAETAAPWWHTALEKIGEGADKFNKVNAGMKAAGVDIGEKKPGRAPALQSRPVFQGEAAPISQVAPNSNGGGLLGSETGGNDFTRFLMQKRMQRGLLG